MRGAKSRIAGAPSYVGAVDTGFGRTHKAGFRILAGRLDLYSGKVATTTNYVGRDVA